MGLQEIRGQVEGSRHKAMNTVNNHFVGSQPNPARLEIIQLDVTSSKALESEMLKKNFSSAAENLNGLSPTRDLSLSFSTSMNHGSLKTVPPWKMSMKEASERTGVAKIRSIKQDDRH